ncbi:MAG: pantoate--beta-alanine ligase [Ginsengibacter sp.]
MILFKHSEDLKSYLQKIKKGNLTTGFVPTMGALHEGHLSLISECKNKDNLTICSIFVNPVQFNNKEDFNKYPSTIEKDILLLEESGCDVLFMPSVDEMYPEGFGIAKHFELGDLEKILEGKFRPGHFNGVCLVVEKLLKIVQPGSLYLGQKDYQQCLVIKKLIELINIDTKVLICPIVREPNGLAMSSRNLRLSEDEKTLASFLHKSLEDIRNNILPGNFLKLKNTAIANLEKKGFKLDYLELADRSDLKIIKDYKKAQSCILLIAAYLKDVRLIDNLFLEE